MSNWTLLNRARVTPQQDRRCGTTQRDGRNGLFILHLNGLPLRCVCSDQEGWFHVSVSLLQRSCETPTWSIMCQVKDLFYEPEDWVVQYHPAKSDYVNAHPGVLHLWKCLTRAFPTPPKEMV